MRKRSSISVQFRSGLITFYLKYTILDYWFNLNFFFFKSKRIALFFNSISFTFSKIWIELISLRIFPETLPETSDKYTRIAAVVDAAN